MGGNKKPLLFALISLSVLYFGGTVWFGYTVQRSSFLLLLGAFFALFAIYLPVIRLADIRSKVLGLIAFSLFLRISLIGMIPNLTDDFYRFIWDGVLLANGINPFEHLPSYYMQKSYGVPENMVPGLSSTLFVGMNSPDYYTIYPPLSQVVYWIGAELFGGDILGNVMVMRFFIILAEAVTIWYLVKILRHFNRDIKWVLLYALNPLIILELAGNLHFEAIMIAFLMAGYYYLLKKKYLLAFLLLALSINTKLVPLMLLPYIAFSLGWKKTVQMSFIVGSVTLLCHAPFYDISFIQNFFSSIELYFQTFEFNASIYYIIRWIGFQTVGYNIIATAGKYLAATSTLGILAISWYYRDRKLQNFPTVVILGLSIYYFLSTIVHPWYITTLVAFVPLTGNLYPIVWSLLLPLTYHVYRTPAYTEWMSLVSIEYIIVYIFFIAEWLKFDKYVQIKDHIFKKGLGITKVKMSINGVSNF